MIEVASLSYTYNKNTPFQTQALVDLSFNIKNGEIIGVLGPSGSGKSCLLRCLAGILTPTAGKIEISPNPVGLLIQEPEAQFFNETVYQEVASALEERGLTRQSIDHLVFQSLEDSGFTGNPQQSPFELSGGEQRRVALASILVLQPNILLLDEPTIGLDAVGIQMVADLITSFRKQGKTLLIVSHNPDFLYQYADRFLVLNEGKLVADFKKTFFKEKVDLLKDLGLALPEIVALQQRKIPDDILAAITKAVDDKS